MCGPSTVNLMGPEGLRGGDFCFPLGLRMVEELLAARGISVSHETGSSQNLFQNAR